MSPTKTPFSINAQNVDLVYQGFIDISIPNMENKNGNQKVGTAADVNIFGWTKKLH